MALARLVEQDWLEGELRIELIADGGGTRLIVLCEYGVGIRERVLPVVRFAVPLAEFQEALEASPQLILPLKITDEPDRILLTPLLTPEARIRTDAPLQFELDRRSLGEQQRSTAPPPPDQLIVVDEALPDDHGWSSPPAPLVAASAESTGSSSDYDDLTPIRSTAALLELDPDLLPENVHTRPTVPRMLAVDPAALAAYEASVRPDPRREED
jgi:hypothetical protein